MIGKSERAHFYHKSKRGVNTRKMTSKKTVLITGATSGFGLCLAWAFKLAGYNLVLHGRNEKRLAALSHFDVPAILADLQTTEGIGATIVEMVHHNIEILINNAAIQTGDLSGVLALNATAAIGLCRGAHSHFTYSGKGGIIINMNSVAGLKGSEESQAYAVSKFALRGFSESVKEAWLKEGVRMIDIYSGAMATGMSVNRNDVHDLIDPQELATFIVGLCETKSFFAREINVQRTKK